MPIVGFQPDPSFPDAGWYVDDAGNKRYGRAGLAPVDTSQATAGGGGMLDHLAPWLNRSGGDQRPAAPPTASDVSAPTPGVPPQPRQGVSVPYDSVPHPPEAAPPPNVPAAVPAPPGQPVYQPDPAARQGMADAKVDALGQGTAAAILREQGQRPHVVRGGMTPTGMTTSVTGATPVTDEVRSQVHDSYNASKNAADASAMAEVGGYNEQRDLYRQQAADELVAKAAKEKQVNEINGYVTQDRADLANAQAELAQNQKDFNPNRLVQGAPGVMGAIFRAMGAWAQVRGHQANNSAADTIDAIVSRDVMQQKQAIDDAKGKVGNVQAQLREHFGDAQLAETAHRALALSWAKNMVQATLAQTGSQTALANGQATIADLSRRQAEAENNFTKQSMGVRSEQVNAQMRPDQVVGGPVGVDKALEREAKAAGIDKTRAETNKLAGEGGPDKKLAVPDGQGGQIYAHSQAQADELIKKHAAALNVIDAAEHLKKLARSDTAGSSALSPSVNKEYAQYFEVVANSMNQVQGQGVTRGEDIERMMKSTGKPWSIGAEEAAQRLIDQANMIYRNAVKGQMSPDQAAAGTGAPIIETRRVP